MSATLQSRSEGMATLRDCKENKMTLGTILLVILVLALLGVIPTWPHSKSWGYAPTGGIGLILAIVLILFLLGRI
jgi:drug/metabolite transporter superfamily protein YnfA